MSFCPIHGTPMRPSTKGPFFYCPAKMPDGTYCQQKTKAGAAPAAAAHPNAPAAAAAPGATGGRADGAVFEARDRLMAAQSALKFAAEVYSGHPDKVSEAIELAHKMYQDFLMPAKLGNPFPLYGPVEEDFASFLDEEPR